MLYLPLILWTVSIQKDMLCLILLAVYLYTYSYIGKQKGLKKITYGMLFVISIFLLLCIKNYMAILLLASTSIVKIADRQSPYFIKRVVVGVGLLFLVFFISSYFPDSVNLPLLLGKKQHGFYDIAGDQPIKSVPLSGNILTYFQNLPNAIFNCFLFPLSADLLTDRIGWIGLVIFFTFIILTLGAIFFPRKCGLWKNSFFVMMFLFCVLSYLLIGESVAYYGALLRYRVIPETIGVILLLQLIDFQKINQLYIVKKNI